MPKYINDDTKITSHFDREDSDEENSNEENSDEEILKKKKKGEKSSKKDIKIFLKNKSRSYLSIWEIII